MSAGKWEGLQDVHLSAIDIDTDALAQHQLHLCRVAELDSGSDNQVNPLLRRRPLAQLDAVMDRRVPRGFCFHLQKGRGGGKKNKNKCIL